MPSSYHCCLIPFATGITLLYGRISETATYITMYSIWKIFLECFLVNLKRMLQNY